MTRKLLALCLLGQLLIASGCAYKAAQPSATMAEPIDVQLAVASQHFIAETDKIEVITSASSLEKSWESVGQFCGTIHCEVVSSSITARTANSDPFGNISLRVGPDDLKKLFDDLQKLGKIAQHTTDREDKTAVVIDTEAKIKNLTSLRDNLRSMLAKPSATVKDLVEIQKQLSDTQAELDSETTQRKVLANETEKVAVDISFRVEHAANGGTWSEITDAFGDSGAVFAESTAALVTFIVAIIPWLILIIPAIWLIVRAWRKFRRKRPIPTTPQP